MLNNITLTRSYIAQFKLTVFTIKRKAFSGAVFRRSNFGSLRKLYRTGSIIMNKLLIQPSSITQDIVTNIILFISYIHAVPNINPN